MTKTTQPRPARVPAALKVQMRPIDDVRPLRRNPRRGDVERVRANLRRWGQYVPIVVRAETAEIVKGNHTHAALKLEGATHVAVVERAIATDAEAEALAIADNVSSDAATWDVGMLSEILKGGEIEIDATLFTETEIGQIHVEADQLARSEAAARLAADRDGLQDPPTPDPPARPTTKAGDVIRLGDHWLICGDARDPKIVAELLTAAGADAIDLLFTSPPYNVDVRYTGQDDAGGFDAYLAALRDVVDAWCPRMAAGRFVAWNIGVTDKTRPWRHAQMLEDAGLTFDRELIWQKVGVPLPTWYHVREQPDVRRFSPNVTHEIVYLFTTGPRSLGDRLDATDDLLQHDVFSIPQATATRDIPAGEHTTGAASSATLQTRAKKAHPAPFPVRFPAAFAHHLAGPGEIVADPYAGAGSVALAAEQIGRRAVMAEIDPGYCDVAVTRWETLTGRKATRPRRRRRKAAA